MAEEVQAIEVHGMFGEGSTFFADCPVVIDIEGLKWPDGSAITEVYVDVLRNGQAVGKFRIDAGGQSSVSFDISSALRTIWSEFVFAREVAAAQNAFDANDNAPHTAGTDVPTPEHPDVVYNEGTRLYRNYALRVTTEYIDSTDGEIKTTTSDIITGGQCLIGRLTEWERSLISDPSEADVSFLENTNLRFGDASTKPLASPERVGRESITSWVDVNESGTRSVFYSSQMYPDDDRATAHAPLVLRDTVPYTDFLFVNRRGALETCSAPTLESMDIEVETTQYTRIERSSFVPHRSLMAISKGGRRSWGMSSGHQTREWLEWWTTEFLMARQWWMLREYKVAGATVKKYVPVTVKPGKKSVDIYDRAKQKMESVEFTVTLALEG